MKNSTLELVKTQELAPGVTVIVTSHQFKGLTGTVLDTGSFSCMNGAYSLEGVKVQLNGIAVPVILQESQFERFNTVVGATDDWFFAELEVI